MTISFLFLIKSLDDEGNVCQIFYNNQVRSRILKLADPDETRDYYNAMKLFDDLAMKFKIEQKLKVGERGLYIYLLDNCLINAVLSILHFLKIIFGTMNLFCVTFRALMRMRSNKIKKIHFFSANTGELVIFDNTRVMHGRKGYTASSSSSGRLYHGGYVS